MRGRKPKPTRLKLVTGNPGKRKLNEREPMPSGPARRPIFLTGRAATVWDEYAPQLIAIGLLTAADCASFAVLCCLMAEFEAGPDRMMAARIGQMRGLMAEFGMTPSARSRMQAPLPPDAGVSIAEKYFGD